MPHGLFARRGTIQELVDFEDVDPERQLRSIATAFGLASPDADERKEAVSISRCTLGLGSRPANAVSIRRAFLPTVEFKEEQ
jgi:hypothetical protein